MFIWLWSKLKAPLSTQYEFCTLYTNQISLWCSYHDHAMLPENLNAWAMVTMPHLLTSSTKFQNESERSIRNISGETTTMGTLLWGVSPTNTGKQCPGTEWYEGKTLLTNYLLHSWKFLHWLQNHRFVDNITSRQWEHTNCKWTTMKSSLAGRIFSPSYCQ